MVTSKRANVCSEARHILYIGGDWGTSLHRAEALRRIGHSVRLICPEKLLFWSRLMEKWLYQTGGLLITDIVERRVLALTETDHYDLVWVDSGALVSSSLVCKLRNRFGTVVSYNTDDGFGTRDAQRWRVYRSAISSYDLVVVVRYSNVREAYSLGAKAVRRVHLSADEVAHSPRPLRAQDRDKWSSDVIFVGTWMPDRGSFLRDLIRRGIPVTIYGNKWQKAPEWRELASTWKGPGLHGEDDYAKAIQCAKVCLGLISHGNRDLHTSRSLEIPALGSLLLAERTAEHEALYRDGEEVVLWSDVEECASSCKMLLEHPDRREAIAVAGQARCNANGTFNEQVLASILVEVRSQ
jgi:spore maturation protein CgeB